MPKAYIQLGASCSSPSICPARATGCRVSVMFDPGCLIICLTQGVSQMWPRVSVMFDPAGMSDIFDLHTGCQTNQLCWSPGSLLSFARQNSEMKHCHPAKVQIYWKYTKSKMLKNWKILKNIYFKWWHYKLGKIWKIYFQPKYF